MNFFVCLSRTSFLFIYFLTRWAIMVTTVVINMLLITLLITGLIRDSKGSLCFFAFAGVLSLITIWILNAIYLGITVFIADYCVSPDEYITRVSEQKHIKNLVYYYTSCPKQTGRTVFKPFGQDLNRAESKLRTAAILYTDNFVKMTKAILGEEKIRGYNFINGVWETERLVDSLRSMTRCEETSVQYKSAVSILCTDSMLVAFQQYFRLGWFGVLIQISSPNLKVTRNLIIQSNLVNPD